MSVTVNNSPIQDYVHPDDNTQPTYEMTTGARFSKVSRTFRARKDVLCLP